MAAIFVGILQFKMAASTKSFNISSVVLIVFIDPENMGRGTNV